MKVRILHCLETIGPGGVEQRRLSIAKYLDKSSFEQRLTCTQVIGGFDLRLREAGVPVDVLGIMGTPANLGYYRRLLKVIREYKPHIIHGAVFEGVISAVVGGTICRTPIILIEETSEPANRTWRGHLLFRVLAARAHAVVATSPAVYDYLTNRIHIPRHKVRLVLNGVEPMERPAQDVISGFRAQLGISPDEFVVGSVGRMVDNHKLFSVLLKAFAQWVTTGVLKVKLLLVGDGVDREKLEQMTAGLGITDKVIFAGHQTDMLKYYSVMDVFALVPAREGFGIAAVEAMFLGIPVIASRVGGLSQIVIDRHTGIHVDAGDVRGLSTALEELRSHAPKARAMGDEGRRIAIEKYSAQRYVKDLQNLYQSQISKLKS